MVRSGIWELEREKHFFKMKINMLHQIKGKSLSSQREKKVLGMKENGSFLLGSLIGKKSRSSNFRSVQMLREMDLNISRLGGGGLVIKGC